MKTEAYADEKIYLRKKDKSWKDEELMRQKDTQRLLQMAETTAKVPKRVWQGCAQRSTVWLQSLQKDKQRL